MLPLERYNRQTILPGFGQMVQEKLFAAKILIVGMGGLGCPALQYLVGAGIGTIGIMDADKISISNLHRQVLFNESEIGLLKVKQAAIKMRKLNADVKIIEYPFALNQTNALTIFREYDLVIDATDNFNSKYLINDVCCLLKMPMIYGAVSRFEGQVSVFHDATYNRHFNYRDLFPVPPKPGEVPNCAEAGVIGVLPGIIGCIQAAEAIKIIARLGSILSGKLLHYDLLQASSYEIEIVATTPALQMNEEIFWDTNYDDSTSDFDVTEISVKEFLAMKEQKSIFVLDVREMHEFPRIDFSDMQIPMSEFTERIHEIPEKEICIVCQHGIRSVTAVQQLFTKRNLHAFSLKGGLTAYFK